MIAGGTWYVNVLMECDNEGISLNGKGGLLLLESSTGWIFGEGVEASLWSDVANLPMLPFMLSNVALNVLECCPLLPSMLLILCCYSYFDESWIFNFYMVSKCSILFHDFRTVFVFVLRPFLPLSVTFLDFNGNFNGNITKKRFLAIKSGRNALQPSS